MLKRLGVKSNTKISTEIFGGITGFFSIIYIVPLIISFYKIHGIDESLLFISLILTIGISNIIAAFIIKKPIIIATSIPIALIITSTLITKFHYSLPETFAINILASIILLLLNIKSLGFKFVDNIPQFIKEFLGIAIGFYLIFVGFKQIGIITFNSKGVHLGSLKNIDIWITIIGLSLMFFFHYKKITFGIIITMAILVLTIIIGKFTWNHNYTGFNKYSDIINSKILNSNWLNLNSLISGFIKPFTYIFAIIIVLLSLIGIPGTCYPIAKSLKLNECQEKSYTLKTFMSISLSSIFYSLSPSGYPSIFAETMIISSAKSKTGISTFVVGILTLFLFLIYPIIPILSNPIVTTPPLLFIGFLMVKSSIKLKKYEFWDFLVGITIISITLFTNSIPHGLSFGFASYVVINIFKKEYKKNNIYVLLLTMMLISFEIIQLI